MKYLAIFLFIGLIGLAAFSHFNMHVGIKSHGNNCFEAASQGINCPKQKNPLDYFAFHLNIFKNFFAFGFRGNYLILFLAFILFAVAIAFDDLYNAIFHQSKFAYYWYYSNLSNLFLKLKFIRWLSLHENSPSFMIY